MPRRAKPTLRVSIYQVEAPLEARAAVRATYLDRDGFAVHEVSVAGRQRILVRGTVTREAAGWAPAFGAWVAEPSLAADLGNRTAAAVLLLPTADPSGGRLWALCAGMGFQLLEQSKIVSGLGRRLAVRCADPERVRSLTHTRLDARAYVARTSIPGGDDLLGFGAGELGDLISRVVGPAELAGMLVAAGGASVEIRGADAINLPVARDPRRLLADLDALEVLLERDAQADLAAIEQLVALKKADPRTGRLDDLLDEALGSDDAASLGLAWPTELADEAVPLERFQIEGLPRRFDRDASSGEPTLEAVLLPLAGLPRGHRVKRLGKMYVQAFSDADEAASNRLPARRWLSFETELDGVRYCMHDGSWYELDQDLAGHVRDRAEAVFGQDDHLGGLVSWPTDCNEAEYNVLLAQSVGGVCLDRQLVQCPSHPRGFEAADVLTPDGTFLHVKKIDRSSPASHLFAQAGVSTQTILRDEAARGRLREIVSEAGGDPNWLPSRPQQVVLVMGNTKDVTAGSLPTFARMRLVRLAEECRVQNTTLIARSVRIGT